MIYLIESGDYFKVGYSLNFKKREVAYNTHNPNWELVATYKGEKYNRDCETFLKSFLKSAKHRGEWHHTFDGWLEYVDNLITTYDPNQVEIIGDFEFTYPLNLLEYDLRVSGYQALQTMYDNRNVNSNIVFKQGVGVLDRLEVARLLGMSENEVSCLVKELRGVIQTLKVCRSNKIFGYRLHPELSNYYANEKKNL